MKIKTGFFLFIVVLISSVLSGNTTRDMGKEPVLNDREVVNWILFYTNIERVNRNKSPFSYDPVLEKAALWQAGYCKKIGTLSHYSDEAGMKTVKDRVNHFGMNLMTGGENVIVEFTSNMANRRYYIQTDSKGTYRDFGDFEVYWYDERQLANVMVERWMASPRHRENILRDMFNSMGSGIARGTYSNENSYYACQVFSGKKNIDFEQLRIINTPGNKGRMFSYPGELEARVISLSDDSTIKQVSVSRKDGNIYLISDPEVSGRHYACLYDKKTSNLYPVKILQVYR